MREVVVVAAARTPFAKFGGALKNKKAVELGALAIKEVMNRGSVDPKMIDYLYYGQVIQAGSGQIPSRQAGIKAGLPNEVPSITVNKVCSSGIVTCGMAYQMIAAGFLDMAIGGGMESMSNAPFALPDMRWGARMGIPKKDVLDLMVSDGLWCAFYNRHMAVHGSEVAKEFGVKRDEQDLWALRSQNLAEKAILAGKMDDEIFPVVIEGRNACRFEVDEAPRFGCTYQDLEKLPILFSEDGTVTAGNAPSTNDGASAVLLASREKAEQLDLPILATVVDYAQVSREPKYIATVPGISIRKVLEQNHLTHQDMQIIEINEAFAAVALISGEKILGMNKKEMDTKVNVNGGAIAYGHPIGATGGRIVATAIYELRRRGGGYAVCGICSGAAQGDALLLKVE